MDKLAVIQLVSARYAWGGMEQYAKDLAQGLKERGHRLFFATRKVDFIIDSYREAGEVHTFPIRNAVDPQTIFGLA